MTAHVELAALDELPDLAVVPIDPLGGKRLEVDGPQVAGSELPILIKEGSKNEQIGAMLGLLRRNGLNAAGLRLVVNLYLRAGLIENGSSIEASWLADIVRSAAGWVPQAPENREYIRYAETEIGPIARQIATLLGESGDVYKRAGRLAYVGADDEGNRLLLGIAKDTLRHWIPQVCELTKIKKDEEFEIAPPDKLISTLWSSPVLWDGVPVVHGITACPIMRRDGTICTKPGYDQQSGWVFDPGDTTFAPVPENPTKAEGYAGLLDVINTVLPHYQFAGPAHGSVALAIPLTMLMRPLFDGPSPLFLIDSAIAGSGKSLLATAWSLLITGRPASVAALCDRAEAEKRITTFLRDGAQLVTFDDHKGVIGAEGVLDRLITATVWMGRLLGESKSITVTNRTTWVMTGRNAAVGGDMARRTLLSRLDPDCDRPDARTGLPELGRVVLQHRGRLVPGLCSTIRAYQLAGSPVASLPGYGSFDGWGIVRQLLVWYGFADPVATQQEVRDRADESGNAAELVLRSLEGEHDARGVMTVCALENSENARTLKDALNALGAYDDRGVTNTKTLGRVLSRLDGFRIGGLRLQRRKKDGKWHYRVIGK